MVNREIKARKRAVKEEKEEIDGEIVRIRKGHPRTNLPVKLPENPTWLKQPNVVTLMAGDFKTVQIRILIAVIEKLQNVIELSIQHLDKYGTSIPCEQLSLFQEYSDRIRVDIAYRDLGVNPDQYKEVKSMVRKLISIPVEFDVKDPITGEESWSITGLFTKANIPKTPYSRGFSLEMDREVAKVFINVDRGFTRYIKEIALRAQSRYTIRMYMLISSWKEKGGFSIYVDRFRKFLKLEDKYPEFKDLYKRVIRPVYDDLFEQADCWFEMAEVYRNSGDTQPYKLNFKVIKSALSKKEEELLKGQKKMITNFCSLHFAMKDEHLQQFIPQITLSNYKAVVTKMLYWDVSFNLGYNKNEITYLPDGDELTSQATAVGYPYRNWYLREWAGVDSQTGTPLWFKVDENGKKTVTGDYNEATRVLLDEVPTPKFNGAISTNLTWKGFTLNANFTFATGAMIYNGQRAGAIDRDCGRNSQPPMKLKDGWSRWEKPGDIATHPQLIDGGNNGADRESTRYLENGDYFKLKSLSLAYSFPKRWLEPLGVKSANLSVGGENLFTITSFSGQDPEILYSADYNGSAGSFGYPTVRRFTLGLNVQF